MSLNNSTNFVINADKENDASHNKPTNDINLFSDILSRDMKGVLNDSTKEINMHEQDRNNCNIDSFFNDVNLNSSNNNFSKLIEVEKKMSNENKHLDDNIQEKINDIDEKKEETLLLNIADNMTCSDISMKSLASSEKKKKSEFTSMLEDANEKAEKPKLVSKFLEELNYNNKKSHTPIFSEAFNLIDISSISEETKQSVYSKLDYDFSSMKNIGLNKFIINEMENDKNKKIEYSNICDEEETDNKSLNEERKIYNNNEILDNYSIQKKSECSDLSNISENESDGIDKLFNRHKIEVSNLSKYFDFHKNEIKNNIDTLKTDEKFKNSTCKDSYTNLENDEIYEYGSDSSNNSTTSFDEKIDIEKGENNENKQVDIDSILTLNNLEKINKNYITLKERPLGSMLTEEESLNLETNYITNDILNDILNIKDEKITFEKFKNYFISLNYEVNVEKLRLLFNSIVEHKKCNMKNDEEKENKIDKQKENNLINQEEIYINIDNLKSYIIERNSKNNNYFNEILKMIIHFNNILLLMVNSSSIKNEDKILFELLVFKFSSSFNGIVETPNDIDNLIKHLNEIIKLILLDDSKNKNLKNIILDYLRTNKISLKNNEILSQLNKSSKNILEKSKQIKHCDNIEAESEKNTTELLNSGNSNSEIRKEEDYQYKATNEKHSIKMEKKITKNLKISLNDTENNTRNLTKDIIISEINSTNKSSGNYKKNNECSENTEHSEELFECDNSIDESTEEMKKERNIIDIEKIKNDIKITNHSEHSYDKNKKIKNNSKKNIKCKNVVKNSNSKIDEINSNSTNGNKKKKIRLEKKSKVENSEAKIDRVGKDGEQVKNANEIDKKIKEGVTNCVNAKINDAKNNYMRNYTNDINMKNVQNYMKRFSSMNNTNNIPSYIIMNKNNRYINSNNALYKNGNFLFPTIGDINDYNTQTVKLTNSGYINENKAFGKPESFNHHIFKDNCQNNFIKKNSINENTDNIINSNQYLWNEKLRAHPNIKHNTNNYIIQAKNCINNNTAHYKENPCLHFSSHLNSTIDNSYISKLNEDYIFASNLDPYKNAILGKEPHMNINSFNKVRSTISINNAINGINVDNDRVYEKSKMILKKDGSVANTSKSDVNKNIIGNTWENNNININNEQYKIKSISNLNQFKNKIIDEKNKRYSISYTKIPNNNNIYIGFRRNINNFSGKNNANINSRRNKSQNKYLSSKSDVHATINSTTNLTSEKRDSDFTNKNLSNFESGLFKLKSFANILKETNKSREICEKNEKESKNVYHRFTEILTNGIKRFTLGSTKSINLNINDEKENKDSKNVDVNNNKLCEQNESNTEKDNNNTNFMIEQSENNDKTKIDKTENNKVEESQCVNKSKNENNKISNISCNPKEYNLNDGNIKKMNNFSNNVDEIKKQTNNIINYRNSNMHLMNNNLSNIKNFDKLNNDKLGNNGICDNIKASNIHYKNFYSNNNNIVNNNNNTLHTYKMHVDNPDMKYKKGYHSNIFNRGNQGLLNIKKSCSNYVNNNRITTSIYEAATNSGVRSGSGGDHFIHFHKRNSTLNGAMPFTKFHDHNKNIINNINTKGNSNENNPIIHGIINKNKIELPNEFNKSFMKRESKLDIMNNSRIINMGNNTNEDIGKYIYDKDHLFLKPITGFEKVNNETNLFMQATNDNFVTKGNQINYDINNSGMNKIDGSIIEKAVSNELSMNNLKKNISEKQTNNMISTNTIKMHNNQENGNRNCILKTQRFFQNNVAKSGYQNELQNNYLKNYEKNIKSNSNHSTKETKFVYKDDTKYNMPTTFLKEFQKNISNDKTYIETFDENNLTIEQIMKIPGVKLGKNYIQDINVCSDWSKFNDYDQKVIKQSIQNNFDNNNFNNFMDYTQFTNTFFSTEK
ncbi:conserved Plasmodium protein, unknown function [Plasmodium berghei]|uniref:Uncharacterized protein n=1 Tax=Plasmodium berghei TaxID=5821 RepID=A0A0Y9YEU8_PLABE|nr:conserved Plasmodium protein, unknown function [Plasmodium berghei]